MNQRRRPLVQLRSPTRCRVIRLPHPLLARPDVEHVAVVVVQGIRHLFLFNLILLSIEPRRLSEGHLGVFQMLLLGDLRIVFGFRAQQNLKHFT